MKILFVLVVTFIAVFAAFILAHFVPKDSMQKGTNVIILNNGICTPASTPSNRGIAFGKVVELVEHKEYMYGVITKEGGYNG